MDARGRADAGAVEIVDAAVLDPARRALVAALAARCAADGADEVASRPRLAHLLAPGPGGLSGYAALDPVASGHEAAAVWCAWYGTRRKRSVSCGVGGGQRGASAARREGGAVETALGRRGLHVNHTHHHCLRIFAHLSLRTRQRAPLQGGNMYFTSACGSSVRALLAFG